MRVQLLAPTLGMCKPVLLAGAVAVLLTSCVAARPGVVPARLQAAVGQQFAATDFGKPTVSKKVRLPDRDGHEQHQFTWKNGCSYVVLVSIATGVVTGWRYASEEALCTSLGHTPLGS
jgi:hypothetical protein